MIRVWMAKPLRMPEDRAAAVASSSVRMMWPWVPSQSAQLMASCIVRRASSRLRSLNCAQDFGLFHVCLRFGVLKTFRSWFGMRLSVKFLLATTDWPLGRQHPFQPLLLSRSMTYRRIAFSSEGDEFGRPFLPCASARFVRIFAHLCLPQALYDHGSPASILTFEALGSRAWFASQNGLAILVVAVNRFPP